MKDNWITHVAIRTPDNSFVALPKPFRHHHIIIVMSTVCKFPIPISGEQGFMDGSGCFLGRKEAAIIALKTGQIQKLMFPPNLYSEDLW